MLKWRELSRCLIECLKKLIWEHEVKKIHPLEIIQVHDNEIQPNVKPHQGLHIRHCKTLYEDLSKPLTPIPEEELDASNAGLTTTGNGMQQLYVGTGFITGDGMQHTL